jgi:hypothetical protein
MGAACVFLACGIRGASIRCAPGILLRLRISRSDTDPCLCKGPISPSHLCEPGRYQRCSGNGEEIVGRRTRGSAARSRRFETSAAGATADSFLLADWTKYEQDDRKLIHGFVTEVNDVEEHGEQHRMVRVWKRPLKLPRGTDSGSKNPLGIVGIYCDEPTGLHRWREQKTQTWPTMEANRQKNALNNPMRLG